MVMDTAARTLELVMLVDDNDTDNFISKRIIEITKFAHRVEVKGSGKTALDYLKENENNPENLPNKCKVIILSSSDNKRDIDKIVNNDHVIKFITKPLTEIALDEIKVTSI